MKREVSLDEIEKLYGLNDMVRADCAGCEGCSSCCRGMGNSVVLDPYDVYLLEQGLKAPFAALFPQYAEWHVEEGLVLPNLKMTGEKETCAFLSEEGRCKIHPFRPGICRLFPLGRIYEEGILRYYLQIHQCPKKNRSKVKVKKWIDTPEAEKKEAFILEWHRFTKELKGHLSGTEDEKLKKDMTTFFLQLFYLEPYRREEAFYGQFEIRLLKAKKLVQTIAWE